MSLWRRARRADRGRVRPAALPRLEVLEDRLVPTDFVYSGFNGFNPPVTSWNDGRAWNNQQSADDPAPGPVDDVELPAIGTQTITCPLAQLHSLTEDRGSGMTFVLSQNLTLGGLSLHGGNVNTSTNALLLLTGSGTFDGGAINGGAAGGLEVVNGGNLTVGQQAGGSETDLLTNLYVGTTPDLQTASTGTVTFAGSNTVVGGDFTMQVGNIYGNVGSTQTVTFGGDPNNFQAGTRVSTKVPQGGTNSAVIKNDGVVNVNCPIGASSGTRTTTLAAPFYNNSIGVLNVRSRNTLDLTADAALNFALQSYGVVNLGAVNPEDNADGNAAVNCHVKGSNFILNTSALNVYGANDGWSDAGDPNGGTLELAVAGTLTLTSSDSHLPWVPAVLNVTAGNLRFVDQSVFAVFGNYTLIGGDPTNSFISMAAGGNVVGNGTCLVRCYGGGVPNNITQWPIIQCAAGGGYIQTNANFGFAMDFGFGDHWSLLGTGDAGGTKTLWASYHT